jgi:RNA polymerase sigma-70 factor (ECF subfamily)
VAAEAVLERLESAQAVPRAGEEDRALVEAFRGGDRRAFETLVRRHQKPVWAVALRFVKDRDVAEDLAQRTFIQALQRIGDLRGSFRPWVLRIVVNLAKNHVRDHAKLVPAEEAPEPATAAEAPDERIDAGREAAVMRAALATLSERQREVVQLRVDGQLSFAEIAEAIGITENNAKVTFHHAVRRLRERIGGAS